MYLVLAIVAVIVLLIFMRLPNRVPRGKPWTVYGSMSCGWTRKQLDYTRNNGIPFVFVDCGKKECAGITAFPTLVSPMGERITGYREI